MTDAATLPAPKITADEPADSYHDRNEQGASMLETFRHSPQKYLARYITRTLAEPEPSAAMQFGTLLHLLLLEPERFADAVAEPMPDLSGNAPDGKKWLRRKGSDHEAWWQEELDKRAGKICADQETIDRVAAAAENVRRHPVVGRMLEDGAGEVSHYWTDRGTGLRCKCRVDWLTGAAALDLKASADPSPAGFARSVVKFGYHRKLAHYLDGLEACYGERLPLVHVAVEPTWPHRVGVYELDDRDRDGVGLGRQQRRETMIRLADCLESGDWHESWESGVTALRLPGWAFTENDYQLEEGDDAAE